MENYSAAPGIRYWKATRRSYTQQHRFYAGIDLHARTLHVCVLDHTIASGRVNSLSTFPIRLAREGERNSYELHDTLVNSRTATLRTRGGKRDSPGFRTLGGAPAGPHSETQGGCWPLTQLEAAERPGHTSGAAQPQSPLPSKVAG